MDKKYPNPYSQPTWKKDIIFFFSFLNSKIINNKNGNVIKFIITKLYGGRLNAVRIPKTKGNNQ